MLAKRFEDILHKLGMAGLEHPLFYHAPVGIRFEIGGEEPIYLDRSAAKLKTNPAYVQRALDRAAAIYRALPEVPDLLRIDGYPDEEPAESLLTVIRQRMGLPVPDEQLPAIELDEDGDTHAQVQFYWDLSGITFQPEQLLQEIISEAVSLADRFERVSDFRSGLCALDIEPEAYYVLCAYSHAADCAALQAVLDKSWAYAGMVGSRTKIDSIFSQLRQKGYTNAQLSRVHTPIGLDLGGETPAEIAVAIMAQIIAIQHGKQK